MKELAELVWGEKFGRIISRISSGGRARKEGNRTRDKGGGTVETEIEGVVEVTREGSQGAGRQARNIFRGLSEIES